jgi:pimeloyl-ACP methyl ester carboxylesterase
MPVEKINGVDLFIERFGSGDPLVLVHGSWVDHMEWPFIVPLLAQRFRVVVYDRRGHSKSERPAAPGSIYEDVADLAAIIEGAGPPAHVVANSMGSSISLRLATERPDLLRTLAAHEPPLFDLITQDPGTRQMAEELSNGMQVVADGLAGGKMEEGAHAFVDIIVGPGVWETMLPDEVKSMLVNNAPTFLDETRDPDLLTIDMNALSRVDRPVMLSGGSESPPFFSAVLDKLAPVLPHATRKTFAGAGHIPHFTHPQEYVQAITAFIDSSV